MGAHVEGVVGILHERVALCAAAWVSCIYSFARTLCSVVDGVSCSWPVWKLPLLPRCTMWPPLLVCPLEPPLLIPCHFGTETDKFTVASPASFLLRGGVRSVIDVAVAWDKEAL